MFGKNRLKHVIRETASYSDDAILTAIFKAYNAFTRGMKSEDDMTVVVVKFV